MVTELQSLRTAIVSITNTIHHLNKEYDQLEQQKDDIEEEMDQLAKQIDSLEKHKRGKKMEWSSGLDMYNWWITGKAADKADPDQIVMFE